MNVAGETTFKKIMAVLTGIALGLTVLGASAFASDTPPRITHPLTGQAPLRTFTVTSTADSGDNTHADRGTLRRALVDANNSAGLDRIVFDFPGSGVRTIRVVNYFPDITDNAGIIIDALHRVDGSMNDDRIEIDASGVRGHHTFHVLSDNNVFQGLIVNGNPDAAGFGLSGADNNVFLGNYIGTDASGTVRKPNHSGILLDNSRNAVIGGTNGVSVGGACTGDCNLLSGNDFHGIVLNTGSANARVVGNFIGLNRSGAASLLNNEDGVLIANSHNNTVGGSTPQERNYIAGNHVIGVEMGLQDSYGNLIKGNYIGTNSQGILGVVGNGAGVIVDNYAHDNIIDGNLISGAGTFGVMVFLHAAHNEIRNNRIGMTASNDALIGNGKQGIEIQGDNNSIHNNRVAYSHNDGIRIKTGVKNLVSQNQVFDNGTFGINLGSDAFTANDTGDGDSGPNFFQNFPVISSAQFSNGWVTIRGSFNSRPGGRYTLEFFQNPACDLTFGHAVGEGKVYLGSVQVTTDGNGNAGYAVTLPAASGIGVVTGTATDNQNNTSEFSECGAIKSGGSAPGKPQLLTPANNQRVTENPPRLDWAPATNAEWYKVTIRADTRKGHKAQNARVEQDEFTPSALPGGKTYYWRVMACNAVQCTKSDVYSFVLP